MIGTSFSQARETEAPLPLSSPQVRLSMVGRARVIRPETARRTRRGRANSTDSTTNATDNRFGYSLTYRISDTIMDSRLFDEPYLNPFYKDLRFG